MPHTKPLSHKENEEKIYASHKATERTKKLRRKSISRRSPRARRIVDNDDGQDALVLVSLRMQSEPVQRQRLRGSCWWHKEGKEKKAEEIFNHRGHKEHRESFSAIVSFINKHSEKHQCFLSTY
jgi:hypothetical protein